MRPRLPAVGWRRTLLPPLIAFLVANVVLAAAAIAGGFSPVRAHNWTSFDSPIYLAIAEHGYSLYECPQSEIDMGARTCGNVGWFPLYPWVVAPLIKVGIAPDAAGVIVSMAFWLALLVVLWNGLLLVRGGRALLPALALAAFAPGAFYYHTVYPVAMAAFLLVVAAICLDRERWLWAGAAGFLATATYPAAGALAGVAGVWLLVFKAAPSMGERVRRIALVAGLTVAGFLAVMAAQKLAVGLWDGYFGVQARFHHGFHLPIHNWLDISRPRLEGLGHISLFLGFQSWLTTLLVVIVVVATIRWWRRGEATALDWLVALWAVAFWILPLCQNVVAYYRTDSLLIVIVVAFARLPARLVLVLAAAGAVVNAGMTLAFMQGVLV